MNLDGQSLLVLLIVGLIAGWLAEKVVGGFGLGIIGSIVVGIIGAIIGTWLLGPGALNVSIGVGVVDLIHQGHDRRDRSAAGGGTNSKSFVS